MKKTSKAWTILLAVMLVLSAASLTAYAEENNLPNEMVKAAENDYLTLYINEADTSFIIENRTTGMRWFSNPADADSDNISNAYYKKIMKSQMQVQYFNSTAQSAVMNNYNDSILNGQFEIDYLEDGVCVTYTIGQLDSALLLPEAISEERFLEFTGRLDESTAKKLSRYYRLMNVAAGLTTAEQQYLETYPGYGDDNFYVLRSNLGAYMQEQLAESFASAGYTIEDYKFDKEQSGVKEDSVPWFIIPVVYRLDHENLVVSIDPEEVSYNEDGYYLVDIDVLPYFGAASDADGYIFVPDGCGALIYLNNGKNNSRYTSYYGSVYGADESTRLMSTVKSSADIAYAIKMPVFGIKANDQALFAIIEEGAGYADISADVAGRTTGYNNVYAGFSYLQYGAASLTDRLSDTSGYNLYSNGEFTGKYQIRYAFLSGEAADYSGMASYYRSYLEDRGILAQFTGNAMLPLYTEYIGAIDKYETRLGFRYRAVKPLTTFAQAEEVVKRLKSMGIENQVVVYSGWMNGGLHGTASMKIDTVSGLEQGGVTLEKLQADMEALDVDLFMTVDLQYVYQDKLLDGYSSYQYGPSYFDRSSIVVKRYNLSDGNEDGELANLISPYFADKVFSAVSSFASKNHLMGLNIGTVSWDLYSDFHENRYTDRQAAIERYEAGFSDLEKATDALLGDNGNAYILPYIKHMINAPMYSNGYRIFDEDIPFFEMVLHGAVCYSGEAINLTDDYRTTLLKSVESGAGLYFKWIFEDNSILKETDYDDMYAVHYGDWIDQAAVDYQQMTSALERLANLRIVKHEILDDLRITTYEDGTEVLVNYGDADIQYGNIVVEAMGFAVQKGGN